MPKDKNKIGGGAQRPVDVPTTSDRHKFAHEGWQGLNISPSFGSKSERSLSIEFCTEDSMTHISTPPSPNDLFQDELAVIEDSEGDFVDPRVEDAFLPCDLSYSPNQNSIICETASQESAMPSASVSPDIINETFQESEDAIISSCSSPIAKNTLKGSEWIKSLKEDQQYSCGDCSSSADDVRRDLTSSLHADGLHDPLNIAKGGLATSFERIVCDTSADPNEEPRVTTLMLTGVVNDGGQTAYTCREETNGNPNSEFSESGSLIVVFSREIVEKFMIFAGRFVRIRSPWRAKRVPTLNTTFILYPFVADVTSTAIMDCHRINLRWHCSCTCDSSYGNRRAPCRFGGLILDDDSVGSAATTSIDTEDLL